MNTVLPTTVIVLRSEFCSTRSHYTQGVHIPMGVRNPLCNIKICIIKKIILVNSQNRPTLLNKAAPYFWSEIVGKGHLIMLLLLYKQAHDKRGIAESLYVYITRDRLTVCVRWLQNTPAHPIFEESLNFLSIGIFQGIT